MTSLKNISDQIKKDGVYVPEVLRPLVRCVIAETVVGPSHIAFRLQVIAITLLLLILFSSGWPDMSLVVLTPCR